MNQDHRPPSDVSPRCEPILNAPPGASWLCAALVVTHLIYKLLGLEWQDDILRTLAFVPARLVALMAQGDSAAALLPTLVSHAFLHGGAMHLLLNVGFLLAFGSVVERRFGAAWMLIVFVVGAAGGAIGQTLAVGAEPIPMIGASGAVYALIGAALPLLAFGRAERRARGMLIFAAALMGLNLFFGVIGLGELLGYGAIAWQAHIGGFVTGLALGWARR